MEELRVKVGDHIAKYADLSWIIGINWDQTKLGSYPTRGDIDSIATDKPVRCGCLHLLPSLKCKKVSRLSTFPRRASTLKDFPLEGMLAHWPGEHHSTDLRKHCWRGGS